MRMDEFGARAVMAALALSFSLAANATEFASPVSVRSGPGAKWPVVATIPAGVDLQVLTCATGWKWRWCQVQAGDVKGWVKEVALARSGGRVDVAGVVTSDATALHKSPRIFSRVLTTIPAGAEVNVLHCAAGSVPAGARSPTAGPSASSAAGCSPAIVTGPGPSPSEIGDRASCLS